MLDWLLKRKPRKNRKMPYRYQRDILGCVTHVTGTTTVGGRVTVLAVVLDDGAVQRYGAVIQREGLPDVINIDPIATSERLLQSRS